MTSSVNLGLATKSHPTDERQPIVETTRRGILRRLQPRAVTPDVQADEADPCVHSGPDDGASDEQKHQSEGDGYIHASIY